MAKTRNSNTRILLVDDDEVVLNSLGSGLGALDFEVDTCTSGESALAAYKANTPDIVVMDFSMGGMNGTESANLMLQHCHRPIIILSAHTDIAIVREAVGLGIASYLVKPIEAERLAPSIEAAMARFAEVEALIKQGANIQQVMEKNRIINTAVGIIMERTSMTNDEAFEKLRNLARKQRRTLQDTAFEIVDALCIVNGAIRSFE